MVLIFCLIAHRFGVHGAKNVTITVLERGVAQGAVCLDGSPPSYAYSPGFGDGSNNWHVYLQGGGWCWSSKYCFERSNTTLGSSTKLMSYSKGKISFHGMLENNPTFNPDFYNWNVVYVFYCDGSMFMSDVEEVDPGFANLLPKSCTTKFSPTLCIFPENLVKDVQTPLFLVE